MLRSVRLVKFTLSWEAAVSPISEGAARPGPPRPSPFLTAAPNRPASCLPLQQRLILRQRSVLSAHFWSGVAHQLHKGVCHRARRPRHVCWPRASRACQSHGSVGPIVRPRLAFGLMWAFQGNCDVVWLSAARKTGDYLWLILATDMICEQKLVVTAIVGAEL